MRVYATATYRDTYFGNVTVRLLHDGRGFQWVATEQPAVHCGYRPVSTVARAIANARADNRFVNVGEVREE